MTARNPYPWTTADTPDPRGEREAGGYRIRGHSPHLGGTPGCADPHSECGLPPTWDTSEVPRVAHIASAALVFDGDEP